MTQNSSTSLGSHDVGAGDNRVLMLAVYIAAAGTTGALVSVAGNACTLRSSQVRFFGSGTYDNLHIQTLNLSTLGLSGSQAFTIPTPGFVTAISGCVISGPSTYDLEAVEVTAQGSGTSLALVPNRSSIEPSFNFTALCTRAQGGDFSISAKSNLLIGTQENRSSVRVGYATGLAPTGTQTFTPAASNVNLMNIASVPIS